MFFEKYLVYLNLLVGLSGSVLGTFWECFSQFKLGNFGNFLGMSWEFTGTGTGTMYFLSS